MTCQDNAATSSPSPIGSQLSARGGRKADPRRLLRELCRLYAAERLLALELPRLFRQSTSISVRLVLSDQRKETGRQIARLELLIGAADAAHSTTAATAPVPGFQPIGHEAEEMPRGAPTAVLIAVPLRATRAAMAAYASTISTAKRLGQWSIAELLAVSLNEKRTAGAVLSRLAERGE